MNSCWVGLIELMGALDCQGIFSLQNVYKSRLFVGGGKAVVKSTAALEDIYLTAGTGGSNIRAYYTYTQIQALRALPDVPQVFSHPTATALGITGIMVLVDKSTLIPDNLPQLLDGGLGWCTTPQATDKFAGTIKLWRLA